MAKTEVLKIGSKKHWPKVFEKISLIIKNKKIFIFPTETVYGIGSGIFDQTVIKKIYQLRHRPPAKALLILIGQKKDLDRFVYLNNQAKKIIRKFWPGPLTIILKKKKIVPSFITAGKKTVAVRMPGSKFLLALLKKIKQPIVAPSANLSGEKSSLTAQEALKYFDGKVSLILDGGQTKYQKESTILDLTQGPAKILREGAVSKKKLIKYL